jgi:hypothetical protein
MEENDRADFQRDDQHAEKQENRRERATGEFEHAVGDIRKQRGDHADDRRFQEQVQQDAAVQMRDTMKNGESHCPADCAPRAPLPRLRISVP